MAHVPVEELLKCFGYYGFGGGWALRRFGTTVDTNRETYCARCPKAHGCWDEHRYRARELFPDMTAAFDKLAETLQGPALVEEWIKTSGQSVDHFVEPYSTLMLGNMEDGILVADELPPKDRGHSSLTWPLVIRHQN